MKTSDIRQSFLDFYRQQGHAIVPSASLLPENDPTTLFTGSGMQPMVPYLLGESHPSGKRLADSQLCFRSGDIDEVGDNRHTTFFEMLGNWSFGDYFKAEQLRWVFTWLVDIVGLDPQRLYVTVFRGNETIGIPRDTETVEIWKSLYKEKGIDAIDVDLAETHGMKDGRIFYYDEKKNWWSRTGVPNNMPVGEPGGPDSEMFWDYGADRGMHEQSQWSNEPCHVNCDCGRFLEIGNSVFMQFIKTAAGFQPLTQQNVDFGGGLERVAMAKNDNPDIFTIDLFQDIIKAIEELSQRSYTAGSDRDRPSMRIIADHMRASTFLVADGAVPSNKDQGYFTRRLIRRAISHAHHLGVDVEHVSITARLARQVIGSYADAYPHLLQQQATIIDEMTKEELQFAKTIRHGMKEFEKLANANISSHDAFILFSTYGFPLELTVELAQQRGLAVDTAGFAVEFEQHQELSRTASAGKFKGGLADQSEATTKLHTATHLLLAALKKVLGPEVQQKGSNITVERLRLDFNYPDKLTPEQIAAIESLVNEAIAKDYAVGYRLMTVDQARLENAEGVFGHKYGDEVKVYTVGQPDGEYFSKEICGGPHVDRTGDMGRFAIAKEESSSSGVRRIKATLSL